MLKTKRVVQILKERDLFVLQLLIIEWELLGFKLVSGPSDANGFYWATLQKN